MKKVLIVLVVLIAAFAAFVATRPNEFKVVRSTNVAAPAPVVYGLIADFHEWTKWSPWEGIDPAMTRTYDGPASGVGAMYSWKGNKDVGSGKQTITEAKPNEKIGIDLQFLEPFPANNRVEFTIGQGASGSSVTWTMIGKANFMMKGMLIFKSMDKMVGPEFERGLEKLKTVAEAEAKKQAEAAAQAQAQAEAAAAAAAAAAGAPPADGAAPAAAAPAPANP